VPQVLVYKGNAISVGIARAVIKINYIGLVNLIMDRTVVKELIQQDCTPDKIGDEIDLLMNNEKYRRQMLDNYDRLDLKMGKPGASAKTAGLIFKYLSQK
jgi:lipid-A-disaccharide synthase